MPFQWTVFETVGSGDVEKIHVFPLETYLGRYAGQRGDEIPPGFLHVQSHPTHVKLLAGS